MPKPAGCDTRWTPQVGKLYIVDSPERVDWHAPGGDQLARVTCYLEGAIAHLDCIANVSIGHYKFTFIEGSLCPCGISTHCLGLTDFRAVFSPLSTKEPE